MAKHKKNNLGSKLKTLANKNKQNTKYSKISKSNAPIGNIKGGGDKNSEINRYYTSTCRDINYDKDSKINKIKESNKEKKDDIM